MPSYIIYSLIAATAFALSNLIIKFSSKHTISNNWTLLVYLSLTSAPFILLVPLLFPVSIPTARAWPFVLLYGVVFLIGNVFFATAVYRLDASTFAPFFQLQSAFIALLAYLFLSERFPPLQYIFIVLMLIGAVLVSLDERMRLKPFFRLATILIIAQQFFHVLSNLSAGFALQSINSFSFLFWGDMTTFLLTLLLVPFIGREQLRVRFEQIKPLFLSGLFSVIGAMSLFSAFQTNVTVSSVLSLLTSPTVLGLSFLASTFKPDLLEHHPPRVYLVRAVGVGLILICVLRLSLWS